MDLVDGQIVWGDRFITGTRESDLQYTYLQMERGEKRSRVDKEGV